MLPNLFGICIALFWVAMVIDCVRFERDNRAGWLWFMVLFNAFGALFYAVIRLSPRLGGPTVRFPASSGVNRRIGSKLVQRRPTGEDEVWKAEAEAKNIGKALQFVKLGNLRYDRGEFEPARHAYEKALEQESRNELALWGMANLAIQDGTPEVARQFLERLLAESPDFQFGAGPTLYGQVLVDLGELETAMAHLEKQAKVRRHPADLLMRAKIHQQQGDTAATKTLLEDLILMIRSSPKFFQQEHSPTLKAAQKLLKAL